MANLNPVAILLKPAPEIAADIMVPFEALSVPFALCNTLDDVEECLRLYPHSTPVFCIPFVLDKLRSGINETMLIRCHEQYKHYKVLAILTLNDKISLHSFYSSGADVVMPLPLDCDQVSLQIQALAKSYQEYREISMRSERERGITRSTMKFLDTARDGVLIVDKSGQLITANRAAERILALNGEDASESFKDIAPQFLPLLDQHQHRENEEGTIGELLSSAQISAKKNDGRSVPLLLRIITLLGNDSTRIGYAIGIGDLSIPRQLASKLVNQERLRNVMLMLSAGALHLLKTPTLGSPGAPLRRLEQSISEQYGPVTLSHVITPLMELVDIILPPESEIRVKMHDDSEIIASMADSFQLIGALLFYAVERTGLGGETALETKMEPDGQHIAIIFSYTAVEIIEPITGDYYMALVQGDHSRFIAPEDHVVESLRFAQRLAEKLGTTIEAQVKSKWEGRIRVVLPCTSTNTKNQ